MVVQVICRVAIGDQSPVRCINRVNEAAPSVDFLHADGQGFGILVLEDGASRFADFRDLNGFLATQSLHLEGRLRFAKGGKAREGFTNILVGQDEGELFLFTIPLSG